MKIASLLSRVADLVNPALEAAIASDVASLRPLHDAMRYSLLAKGKRIRPALCLASCEAVGGRAEDAVAAATALELVHTYSLIHDDLPCMDDDDFRRGVPTNHRVHGEAMAVLAGDALLTRAFGVLTDGGGPTPPKRTLEMVAALAQAAGAHGMVGGQALDLAAERKTGVELAELREIHTRKTGALFEASCQLGGLAGGANADLLDVLRRFGAAAGYAFQIADDLLDETGSRDDLGKDAGRDRALGKATGPGILGEEESRRVLASLVEEAVKLADGFGESGEGLAALVRFVKDRDR
ncbi:MAG: polyprenyl synthetase family protein [Gemmatimonadota bacterium]|jgi:geranylgeranyl diphosphate synthase type II|nr:polyprenyl synthetase family protein [Gemmatimonadota bacterium]MDP6530002.1 polyprenyl synthetase family protein [Gemmatimonadota bacterium]MDP6802093.1 polyprenyl synthetase family protein [Gemmatimonadota bacterium]MDP7032649.1 polyprenyl synthetase family protein [Gemmatimonadota bacterium]